MSFQCSVFRNTHRGLAHFSRESKPNPGFSIDCVQVLIGKIVPVPLPGSAFFNFLKTENFILSDL